MDDTGSLNKVPTIPDGLKYLKPEYLQKPRTFKGKLEYIKIIV